MAAPTVHLTVCLFFLGVLVLLRMEREKMRLEHPESFRNIAAGVSILAFVSLLRLAHVTGLLGLVPFISEEMFRQLTLAIASITGVILLVSGVSLWLPLGRTLRLYNKLRIRRLDLLRRIEQLVGVESRLTVILEKTLGYMIEQFDLEGGAVFVRARQSRHMLLLRTHSTVEDLAEALPHSSIAQSDAAGESGAPELHIGLPDGIPQPTIVLPVEIRGRVAAAFALWSKQTDTIDDDRVILKLTCDTIARRLQAETHRIEREFRAGTRSRRDALRAHVSESMTFEEKLSAIAETIADAIPSEICSFTITFDDNDTRRFTLGRPGSLLTEKGMEREQVTASTNPGLPQLINDIDQHPDDPTIVMFRKAAMKSVIALPMLSAAGTIDRMIVGCSRPNAFAARDVEFVASLADLVRSVILAEVNRRRSEQANRRFALINDFLDLCSGYHRDSDSIFDEAARSLRAETGAAVVRISMFENDAAFIRSRACAAAHPIDRAVPTDGHLIQAIMPLHRRVRETGESVAVGGSRDQRMSRAEAQQVYQADLRSALLVPITIAKEVRGVIALAERRRRTRFNFTSSDRALAESFAAALSIAVRLHETPWGVVDEPAEAEPVQPPPNRLTPDRTPERVVDRRFVWESEGLEKITVER